LGLWQSVYLALPYSYFLLGGINNGLSRELPYYIGAGDDAHASRLTSTTQFFTGLGCLITMIAGICTVAFLVVRHYDFKVISAVAVVTLLIIFNFYRNYLTVTFRSKSDFIDLSWAQGAEAILMVATLPLVYYLRYTGMLLRLVVVGGLVVYVMHRIRPLKVSSNVSRESLLLLLKTGIPIFALDYLRSCASTLDRLALLHFGGVQQVGYYAVGATACAGFEVLPTSVAHYIYPRMSYRYGQDKSARGLWGLTWKATVVLAVVMLPLAIAGWFCLPPVIAKLFPKYVAGTRAAQLMLFAAVGTGAAVGVNALWSLKAWKSMIAYQVSSSVLYAVGPFVGIRLCQSPLTGVAAGVVGARLLSAMIGFGITYDAIHRPAEVSEPSKSES
jgi:O-antigen/teichoic acid export membrane protein